MKFEEAVSRLEAIVQRLEAGGDDLEAQLKLFEEGVALSRSCEEILAQAEGRIEELLGDASGDVPEDLAGEERPG
jgi:exodeoxyribonuclease VII small subunit